MWNGASWLGFFYNTSAGHWQRIGDATNRDGFTVSAGTPIFVQRRAAGTSADEKTINFPAPGS